MGLFDDLYGGNAQSSGLFDQMYGGQSPEEEDKDSWFKKFLDSTIAQYAQMPRAMAELPSTLTTLANKFVPSVLLPGGEMLGDEGRQAIADKVSGGLIAAENALSEPWARSQGYENAEQMQQAIKGYAQETGERLKSADAHPVINALGQTVAEVGPDALFDLAALGKVAAKGLGTEAKLASKQALEASRMAQDASKVGTKGSASVSAFEGLLEDLKAKQGYAKTAAEELEANLNNLTVEQRAEAERLLMQQNPMQEFRQVDGQVLDNQPILYEEATQLAERERLDAALETMEATESEMLPITSNSRGVSLNKMDYEPNLVRTPLKDEKVPSGIEVLPNNRNQWLFRDQVDDISAFEPHPRETREFIEDTLDDAMNEAERTLDETSAADTFSLSDEVSSKTADAILFEDVADDLPAKVQNESAKLMEAAKNKEDMMAAFEKALDEAAPSTPEQAMEAGEQVVKSVKKREAPVGVQAVDPTNPSDELIKRFTNEVDLSKVDNPDAADAAFAGWLEKQPEVKLFREREKVNEALKGLGSDLTIPRQETLEDTILRLKAAQEYASRKAKVIATSKASKLQAAGELASGEAKAAYVNSYVQEVNDTIALEVKKLQNSGKVGLEAQQEIQKAIDRISKKYRLDPNLPNLRMLDPVQIAEASKVKAAESAAEQAYFPKPLQDMKYQELVELGQKLNNRGAPQEVFQEVINEVRKRIGGVEDQTLTKMLDEGICG